MQDEQKLYNEETLHLLREIAKAINRQDTTVKVDAPVVNVEPTPVTVNPAEVVIDTQGLEKLLQGVVAAQKDNKTVNVANFKAFDRVEVKNLAEMEKLLKQLIAKETVINVDTKAAQVNVSFPTSTNAREYIPVRLTDGEQFYNAVAGLAQVVKSGSISDQAMANLEALTFTGGNLNVNAEVTVPPITVDSVGVRNVAEARINPATEETAQAVADDTESIKGNQTNGQQVTQVHDAGNNPIDFAKSANQLPNNHQVEVSNFPATQPVSGTVAISNPTTNPETGLAKETTLGSIKTSVEIIDNAIAGNEMQVDVVTSALPTGAATEATLAALLVEMKINNGAYTQRTDDAGGGVTYRGWAVPGTATSAAGWRVTKITETTGDYVLNFADGNNNFDNVWDNRASLSYS